MVKTIKLKIDGMHCESCSKLIAMSVKELDGVDKIDIDDKSKTAQIDFDEEKIDKTKIVDMISELGYQVE